MQKQRTTNHFCVKALGESSVQHLGSSLRTWVLMQFWQWQKKQKTQDKTFPLGCLAQWQYAVLYVLMALTLCSMVPTPEIDQNAPYSVAFQTVGMSWVKYVVTLGALKWITTVLLVGAVGQVWYLTHIAHTHLIPSWFSLVNKRTRTPANATASMILASAIIAFFTELAILGNLLSLSSLFIFFLLVVGILVWHYYIPGVMTKKNGALFFFFLFIIISSSILIGAYWGLSANGWILYAIFSPVWFFWHLGPGCVCAPSTKANDLGCSTCAMGSISLWRSTFSSLEPLIDYHSFSLESGLLQY